MDEVFYALAQTNGTPSTGNEMTHLLNSLVGASPIGVLMIVAMWMCFKHIKEMREESERRHDERNTRQCEFHTEQTETMKQIASDCREVIKDNTAALRENSSAIAKASR